MAKLLTSLILGAAVLAPPVLAAPRDTSEMQLQKMLEGRVAGAPVNCIAQGPGIPSTIIDGKAIVYRSGRTLYVNEPQSDPRSLRSNDLLVTRAFGSQLCSTDVVHMVDRLGGFPRSPVFLGQFVPYTKPKAAR